MAVVSRRRLPSEESFTAWLDDRNLHGGILQAEGTPGSEAWIARLGATRTPRLRVDFRREGIVLILSIVFLSTIFLCPRQLTEIGDGRRLDIDDETAGIEDRIQVLEQSSELSEEKIAELKEMLQDIRENGLAEESSKTYELLDVLEERVENEASGIRNSLSEQENSMEMLAKALEELAKLGGANLPTASSEIAKFISQLAENDPALAEILSELAKHDEELSPSELARRTADKALTKEQLEKLAEALKKNADRIKEKLRQMAEQMKRNGGGDCGGGMCENSVPFDEKSLEEWLNSNCPATAGALGCEAGAMAGGTMPGNAGISRGRGDAPLEYTGENVEFDAEFKRVGIGGMAKPDDTSVISRTLSAPSSAVNDAEAAGAGTLGGGKAESESKGRAVHPQHRRAVRQFFGE